ncbi:Mitochondrial protein import protein [Venturia nashicola]|uniref:Mitochondrial protein import protein n=1 Tax=Venturia nashicola TaxID=86259 RepID=A0A4Z1P4N4_9PEZI|nr:Mitochondrial protein import protein [Venturia nashicola]TLD25688.1 Mitochondrial protein import protein [Venturia nashicola]
MLSPAPYSMIEKSQNEKKSPPKLSSSPEDSKTPTKSPGSLRGEGASHDRSESPLTPLTPSSAFRKPSAGNRRKSVTFSDMLSTSPSLKSHYPVQQSERSVVAPRPDCEAPEATSDKHRHFLEFEASLSASGIRNVSNESSSTAHQVSDGSMPPPSSTYTVSDEFIRGDFPIIISDATCTATASSECHSRQTSGSSRVPSTESKPLSKVKTLAQAFNNLTASKESLKGRASSSGHKKSDSWTERIRRSISGSIKKGVKELKKKTNEEVEPESPVKEAYKTEEVEVKETGRLDSAGAAPKVDKDEEEQPLLAMSPPGSPSMIPTEPRLLSETLEAWGVRNDGRLSMNLDPFSSQHSRVESGGLMPTLATELLQLANSPAVPPSMELTETPFVFPVVAALTRLTQCPDSVLNDESHGFEGNRHSSFLGPQLNRKTSSIYSRSENGGTPRKQGNFMVGGPLQTPSDNGNSRHKQIGMENDPSPTSSTPIGSLHVHKRTTHMGSPSMGKGHGHKRSNAATLTASRPPSGINHSAHLTGTPTRGATQPTRTRAAIDYSTYMEKGFIEYLNQNSSADLPPPSIPPRHPARVVSAYDNVPAHDPSWATRLAIAAHAGVSRQASIRASRQMSAQHGDDGDDGVSQPLTDDGVHQPLTDNIKARAHTEGANSGALPRLKREARYPGRLNEKATDGLVGKEQFAEEDRGDDSIFI